MKISKADVSFGEEILIWKSYTINKTLPTTKQIQQINRKKFVIATLNANSETFVMHVAIKEQEKMLVYSKKQAQIQNKAQVGALIFDEASMAVLEEYSDYRYVFSAENIVEL